DDDAGKAYRAIYALAASGDKAVAFLKSHLTPSTAPDTKRVEKLIADLDSEEFAVRDTAAKELTKLGEVVAPRLQRALEGAPSAEPRRRLSVILARLQGLPTGESLRALRAIQALEAIGTADARDVLRILADAAPSCQTREANAVLERLAR